LKPHAAGKGGEPKTVPKHRRERRGFDDKTLSVYGPGLPAKAVQENLKDIYNDGVPPELISRITDEVKGLSWEWRAGPLEADCVKTPNKTLYAIGV
jgi:transposase-like protein